MQPPAKCHPARRHINRFWDLGPVFETWDDAGEVHDVGGVGDECGVAIEDVGLPVRDGVRLEPEGAGLVTCVENCRDGLVPTPGEDLWGHSILPDLFPELGWEAGKEMKVVERLGDAVSGVEGGRNG
jgi:hypothetical protein